MGALVAVWLAVVALGLAVAVAEAARRAALFLRRSWRHARLTATIPGPRAYPVIGNFLDIAGSQEGLYGRVLGIVERHGPLFRFWVGPLLAVNVYDPDDLRVVFTSPHLADKSAVFYDLLHPVIGRGLITLNGADYRRHRKIVAASLHLDILQEFVRVFHAKARLLVERLAPLAASGEVFNATPHLGWCASHSLGESVLAGGGAGGAPGLDKEALVRVSHDASRLMLYRALRPWYRSDALFTLSAEHRPYRDVVNAMDSFAGKLLKQRTDQLADLKVNASNNETDDEPSPRRGHGARTFLENALPRRPQQQQGAMSLVEVRDELKTLLFAGASTSTDLQSLFMMSMALMPDVQRKVQAELDAVFGSDPSRAIRADDLPRLVYLECAIKETLRVFPPVPVFARQAKEDVVLPSGHVLPKGVHVGVIPLLVHRNPDWFPEPLAFDPDRFLPENAEGRHPYAYIPFSAGPRHCIGRRYALMFAKTVAATVLRHYDVLPDPRGPTRLQDVPIVAGIALTIRGGARIRLRPRRLAPTT